MGGGGRDDRLRNLGAKSPRLHADPGTPGRHLHDAAPNPVPAIATDQRASRGRAVSASRVTGRESAAATRRESRPERGFGFTGRTSRLPAGAWPHRGRQPRKRQQDSAELAQGRLDRARQGLDRDPRYGGHRTLGLNARRSAGRSRGVGGGSPYRGGPPPPPPSPR